MNVTRTANPNGTYRYEIDGRLQMKASKVLYTHVSTYTNGAVKFHKSEAAANNAQDKEWTKSGVVTILDGNVAAAAQATDRLLTQGRKVLVNRHAVGATMYVGRKGKVHSKVTGDDGKRYIMVEFNGITWPFEAHDLDLV